MPIWKEATLVGFDTETTGLSISEDRIFEVGLTTFENGELIEDWDTLIDPSREMSKVSIEKTGVDPSELVGKPLFSAIVDEVLNRIQGRIVVGYNSLGFDIPLLEAELARVNRTMPECRVIDVLVFAKGLVRKGGHKLGEMIKHYGLTMDTAHRASADAAATVRLLLAMAPDLPPDLDDLITLQAQWRQEQRAKRAVWRKRPGDAGSGQDSLLRQEYAPASSLVDSDGKVTLGPGYLYGTETDPIRAFIGAYLSLGGGSGK
ncbi:MAG: 3'-5' exonuclease [Deltaproteobacteria bacterium]|nr:3'-5' exonuclease [Deltaproteobacteria bacterium]